MWTVLKLRALVRTEVSDLGDLTCQFEPNQPEASLASQQSFFLGLEFFFLFEFFLVLGVFFSFGFFNKVSALIRMRLDD